MRETTMQKGHEDGKVSNILVHVGTKHLPHDDLENVIQKIGKLRNYLETEIPNANIYFSVIIPRFSYQSFESKDYVNYWVYNHTCYSNRLNFINQKLFVQENEIIISSNEKSQPAPIGVTVNKYSQKKSTPQ